MERNVPKLRFKGFSDEWKKENNVMEGYPQSTLLIKEDFYNKLKESNLYDELINRFIDS
mgnify:CR=1 FL=1